MDRGDDDPSIDWVGIVACRSVMACKTHNDLAILPK
jgi:hypothetical protein